MVAYMRIAWVVGAMLVLGAVPAGAQGIGGQGTGAGFGNISGSGITPLGGVEGQVLEHIKVGVPIAPGISLDQKFAFDRGTRNDGLRGTGMALSFPWADVTFGLSGEVTVNAVGPGIADVPNYLIGGLLPPGFQTLLPFKLGGGTSLGSVSLGSQGAR